MRGPETGNTRATDRGQECHDEGIFHPGDVPSRWKSGHFRTARRAVVGSILGVFCLGVGIVSSAAATGPTLVKDIATAVSQGAGSEPVRYIPGPKSRHFHSQSSDLWTTDGTEEGTSLVAILFSEEDWYIKHALDVNGISYVATSARLWRSDGTREGCFPIWTGKVMALSELNGFLYFVATTPSRLMYLCRSDGSQDGTVPIAFLSKVALDRVILLTGKESLWIAAGNWNYYAWRLPVLSVWRSDGTAAGTRYALDIQEGAELAVLQDTLFYFSRPAVQFPYTLYRTEGDGREPEAVPGGVEGDMFFSISGTATTDDALFFVAHDTTEYRALWTVTRTAPTATRIWAESTSTAGTVAPSIQQWNPWSNQSPALAALGSGVVFPWPDGEHGTELWHSDGTTAGTHLLKDIWPGPVDSNIEWLTPAHGRVYFFASDDVHGRELWSTDGTSEGTNLTRDIFPGPEGSRLESLTMGEGAVYFQAYDGIHGGELWRSDGTLDGTRLVKDATPPTQDSSNPHKVQPLGEDLVFMAWTRETGEELWRSDGTTQGTSMIRDIYPGTGSSIQRTQLDALATWRNLFFFLANDGARGQQVWRSDGTKDGTSPIVNLFTESLPDSALEVFPSPDSSDLLYFAATAANGQSQVLYRTDGTVGGTAPVQTGWFDAVYPVGDDVLYTCSSESYYTQAPLWRTNAAQGSVALVSNALHFSRDRSLVFPAADPDSLLVSVEEPDDRTALWRIEATSQETRRVAFLPDLWWWVNMGRIGGQEILLGTGRIDTVWTTDGTSPGTHRVMDLPPPGTTDGDGWFHGSKGSPTFFRPAGYSGMELWVTDGTTAGTGLLRYWPTLPDNFYYETSMGTVGGIALYIFDDGIHGRELWGSDGTDDGTRLLRDVYPGPLSSDIQHLLTLEGIAFFSAGDGATGRELWVTDGTPLGTVRIADLNPGLLGSDPDDLCHQGNVLYFAANGGSEIGRELWALPLADLPLPTQIERDILPRILNQPGAPVVDDQNADAALDIADFIRARAER